MYMISLVCTVSESSSNDLVDINYFSLCVFIRYFSEPSNTRYAIQITARTSVTTINDINIMFRFQSLVFEIGYCVVLWPLPVKRIL